MKKLLLLLCSASVFGIQLNFQQHILLPLEPKGELGGLSGIRYEKSTNSLYAISDDRSTIAPARMYKFSIKTSKGKILIDSPSKITLKDMSGDVFKKSKIDFEDIVIDQHGNFIISDEGNIMGRDILPPRVLHFNREGKQIDETPVAEELLPKKENGYFIAGTRNNLSLESLSLSPDKKKMYTMPENAIKQDGEEANLDKGCLLPLYQYGLSKNKFQIEKKFLYPYGPIETIENRIKSAKFFAGITSVLAYDKGHLLVLERVFYPLLKRNKIKIYAIHLSNKTKLKKKLILDLDDIKPKLNKEYQRLDNLEGMTFGPTLPNGNKSLILVSDNNFSKYQRTHFIVFEIKN